ncbi:MAG TPA: type II toxin-antitoxin system HicA family toxin [Thermoplasmata archaeon]|nr:type II toxin-antitoxin system HicA family toxin [Thermoplasmata archaeon]
MPRLPVLSAREVWKALRRAGFEVVSHRGSHTKLRRVSGSEVRTAIVPAYDEIPKGVLVSILRQAGLTREEFLELL